MCHIGGSVLTLDGANAIDESYVLYSRGVNLHSFSIIHLAHWTQPGKCVPRYPGVSKEGFQGSSLRNVHLK